MPTRLQRFVRARAAWGAVAVVLGCAVPAVVSAGGTAQPSPVLAVDGGYAIGDVADDRPVAWTHTDGIEAREHPFLIAVSIDGRVVGFVRSDELFSAGAPPDQPASPSAMSLQIVDAQGRRLGQFVDGRPVLDSNQ